MPCGCGGSGQWQAGDAVQPPESNIHNPANFWTGGQDVVVPADPNEPPGGYASWTAEHGTTHAPPAPVTED